VATSFNESTAVTVKLNETPGVAIDGADTTKLETGPPETTKLTGVPPASDVPAVRLWLITTPAATEGLAAVVTAPTVRPALTIAAEAAACVSPTMAGTAGPVETTKLTG
jgi:hypothetical protein